MLLRICNYSHALKKQEACPLKDYKCKSCTEDTHIYMYIESLYQKNTKTRDILKFLQNPRAKIRLMAVQYILKFYGLQDIPAFMHNDPFYKIRKLCINSLSRDEIISYLDDVNDEIILGVLEHLYERYCEFKDLFNMNYTTGLEKPEINNQIIEIDYDLEILCKKMTIFMTHPNKQIRIITSKLVSIFYKLDTDRFYNLLFKNIENDISGTIVFGLEDECRLVRKNTIISLYIFYTKVISKMTSKVEKKVKVNKKNKKKIEKKIDKKAKKKLDKEIAKLDKRNKEIVKIAVEYFVNTINDEDEEVRNTAIFLFHEMSNHTKFKLTDDLIMQISYNIIQNTKLNLIDLHLIGIFRNLSFKSEETLLTIINKFTNKLDTKLLVNTLYDMFNSNTNLLRKSLYKYSIFAEQEHELINKDFVVKILINYVLRKDSGIKVNKSLQKYFKYIEILLNKSDMLSNMKDNLILMIQAKKYKNVFDVRGSKEDTFLFMKLLFKGMVRNNPLGILKLNDRFTNVNITKEILLDDSRLIQFIKDINMTIVRRN